MNKKLATILIAASMTQGCALLNVPDDMAYDPYNQPTNETELVVGEADSKQPEFVVPPTTSQIPADYDEDELDRKAPNKAEPESPVVYWP